MANKTVSLLFKRLLRLDMSGSAPPWPLTVWNDETQTWDEIGNPETLTMASLIYELDGTLLVDSDGSLVEEG